MAVHRAVIPVAGAFRSHRVLNGAHRSAPTGCRLEIREGAVQPGGVARVVVGADRQRDVVERGQWVAILGLAAGQSARCAVIAASTADLGEANAAHTPSPVCLNNQPP
jgi:hypothetical protein